MARPAESQARWLVLLATVLAGGPWADALAIRSASASERLTAEERKAGLVSETLPPLRFDPAALIRPISERRRRLLDSTLAVALGKSGATGLSACIDLPGDGVWRGAVGVEDTVTRVPVSPASRFHAGSIGKMVTAVLILQRVEQRRLTLDARLSRWFPEMPYSKRITVDHLLSHTSGLIANPPDAAPAGSTLIDRVSAAAAQGLLFEPGTGFSYSNAGYMALGLILEKEHGRPLAELVDSLFIRRLGLAGSRALTAANRDQVLMASTHLGKPGKEAIDYSSTGGAGILATTPQDLVRALRLLLAGEILGPEATRGMVSRMYPMQLQPPLYWGRGLMVLETPLGRMFYLAGRIKGFGAMAGYLPGRDTFVSVMVNDDHPVEPVMFALVKALEE